MGLTRAEQETIVNLNEAEDVAYIYTSQPKIIGRLKRNPAADLVEEGRFERSPWARFTIPAQLVSFHSVVRTYELTEEEKQERRDRMARSGLLKGSAVLPGGAETHQGPPGAAEPASGTRAA
jgi:hypothetical protein